MILSYILLLIEVIIYLFAIVKTRLLLPLIIKFFGALFTTFSIIVLISKTSHYNTTFLFDQRMLDYISNCSLSIFDIATVNNAGVFLFSLSTVAFLFHLKKYFFTTIVFSLSTFFLFINTPHIRQFIYNMVADNSHNHPLNLEVVTTIFNNANLIFLVFIILIPYIYLMKMFFLEKFIYNRKKLLYTLSIYLINDLWIITVIFSNGMKHFFYTNCSLLCYPLSPVIVLLGKTTLWISMLFLIFSFLLFNTFVPISGTLKKLFRLNNNNNVNPQNISMIFHTYKNAFVSISNLAGVGENFPLSVDKRLDLIKKTADEQITTLSNSIDTINDVYQRVKVSDNANVIECLETAIGRLSINPDIKLIKNFKHKKCITDANSSQLTDMFFCLIDNSVDSLKNRAMPTITITTETKQDTIFIEIRDNGCGIQNIKEALKPFSSTKMGAKNFGIGLPSSKKLVKSLGGTLELKSKVNSFTFIQITLPLTNTNKKTRKEQF